MLDIFRAFDPRAAFRATRCIGRFRIFVRQNDSGTQEQSSSRQAMTDAVAHELFRRAEEPRPHLTLRLGCLRSALPSQGYSQ